VVRFKTSFDFLRVSSIYPTLTHPFSLQKKREPAIYLTLTHQFSLQKMRELPNTGS
jgi:hypothetical protein